MPEYADSVRAIRNEEVVSDLDVSAVTSSKAHEGRSARLMVVYKLNSEIERLSRCLIKNISQGAKREH